MFHIYRDPVTGWRVKPRGLPSFWCGTRDDAVNRVALMWHTQTPATVRDQIRDGIAYLATLSR